MNKDRILYSESLVFELRKDYDKKEIEDMLGLLFFSGVLIKIKVTKEETEEAMNLAKARNIPFIDCLGAVQARDNDAILITQDSHFFNELKDIITAKRPFTD